jgi:predicted GIY-YIG superfamily endonuclease
VLSLYITYILNFMIKTIYKIVKPSDPMTVYIGSTVDLEIRFICHKSDKKCGSLLAVHLWMIYIIKQKKKV